MKKIFQSYHLFLGGKYPALAHIVYYIILPLLLMAFSLLGDIDGSGSLLAIMAMITISAEMLIDTGAFGGIQRKNARQTSFLKLSNRGFDLLKNALYGDFIRRICVTVIPCVLPTIVFLFIDSDMFVLKPMRALAVVMCVFLCQDLLIFLTRAFNNFTLNIIILSFFSGGLSGGMGALLSSSTPGNASAFNIIEVIVAVTAAAAVGLEAFFRIRLTLKKAKEGYYD